MSLFFVKDRQGISHEYLEREFYILIMREDDHEKWIAPITEIVKVVRDPDFSFQYAQEICRKMLRSYAVIQEKRDISNNEQEAIWKCWNILDSGAESNSAKASYIHRRVRASMKPENILNFKPKGSYQNFCESFLDKKDTEWHDLTIPELEIWLDKIENDFKESIRNA